MSITYVFAGDSITCANRFFDSEHAGLGHGYVHLLSASDHFHRQGITCINKGFDGLTCTALRERLYDGRIVLPPSDTLFLLIGINDVGVSANTGKTLQEQQFSEMFSDLLDVLKQTTSRLICMTPFLFPYPAEYLTWMKELDYAGMVIRTQCQLRRIPCLDLASFFHEQLQHYSVSELSTDGIHLTELGHALLADHLLCKFTSGSLFV